ncbi:E3 SUMO-protein ligase CBX4 [Corchorus capsularis]|uniref:E3 SUMO-protein ligase CBX4 n=1 Tax=Corchorus capsularis TaxID=210143 RepID=A0A1R3JYA2_COCAP|nr:E3 SUMO-protein ligase CBX4 [Corchorus capsularis]
MRIVSTLINAGSHLACVKFLTFKEINKRWENGDIIDVEHLTSLEVLHHHGLGGKQDIAEKTNKGGKSSKNKFNIFDYLKPGSKGDFGNVEMESPLDKGKKAFKRKAHEHLGMVEASPKRYRDSDVGAVLPGNAMVLKECTLSMKLLETESAFESPLVTRKSASNMLALADKFT